MKSKIIMFNSNKDSEAPQIEMTTASDSKNSVNINGKKLNRHSKLAEVIDTVNESMHADDANYDNIEWFNNTLKFRGLGTLNSYESNLAFTDLIACALRIDEFNDVNDFKDLTKDQINVVLDKLDAEANNVYVGVLETMSSKPDCYYCIRILPDSYKLIALKSFNKSMRNNQLDYYKLYDLWKYDNFEEIAKGLNEIKSASLRMRKSITTSKILHKPFDGIDSNKISPATVKYAETLMNKMQSGEKYEVKDDED